eukprot:scaffold307_cov162-Amphora_coffeaeformis.AAC.10
MMVKQTYRNPTERYGISERCFFTAVSPTKHSFEMLRYGISHAESLYHISFLMTWAKIITDGYDKRDDKPSRS